MAEDMGITPPVQARTHNHHGTHARTTAHACTHIGTQARARAQALTKTRTHRRSWRRTTLRTWRACTTRCCSAVSIVANTGHTIKPTNADSIDPRGRVPRSTAACPRDRRGTVQRGTAQRGTAQHGTAQRGTAQRGSVPRQRTLCGFSGACPLGPRFYFVSSLDQIRSSSTARQSL